MNELGLADRLVALGIFSRPEQAVIDWRVAGFIMEMMDTVYVEKLVDNLGWQATASTSPNPGPWVEHKNQAVAIVLACCDVLESRDGV